VLPSMASDRGEEYVRFLEDQVHRLNVELARLQRASGGANGMDSRGAALSSTLGGPGIDGIATSAPSFLLDFDGLPPLIHAYEEQVNTKPFLHAALLLIPSSMCCILQRTSTLAFIFISLAHVNVCGV
jgi:hypothetical protein